MCRDRESVTIKLGDMLRVMGANFLPVEKRVPNLERETNRISGVCGAGVELELSVGNS